jgi:GT2 family glycosyltransferase
LKVVVGSAFRNSAHQVSRYFKQVGNLQRFLYQLGHRIRVSAVEGDSTDDTVRVIQDEADFIGVPATVVSCAHNGPVFGSTEQPERMVALSKVGNAIFDSVLETDDILVYVESDLVWDASTIMGLIWMADTQEQGFDIFAPMVFAGDAFYDVWGFRKDGVRFGPFAPYHSDYNPRGFTEVDSVGSCLVMRTGVARRVRIPDGQALVGWCNEARRLGYKIAVHGPSVIRHPA